MKNIGIIAEYNPLHNGHLYQMQENGDDNNIIVALSGNFTERGDIAMLNKYHRASLAVKHGASMVVEIPALGVLSCAEHYARCAVRTLSLIGNIDALSFGSECGDIGVLEKIASIEEDDKISDAIRESIKQGNTYPKALSDAIIKHSNIPNIEDIIAKPNNILGIEYIKALRGTGIQPTTIKRCGNNYNDKSISMEEFASATSIRENIESEDVSRFLPNDVLEDVRKVSINSDALLHSLYQKLIMENNNIQDILNISEGLDNRIKNSLLEASTFDKLLESIKTKRYTMSRIKRAILDILLGIDKKYAEHIDSIDYVTVLAIRRDKLDLLSNCNANIITKYNDYAKTNHPFKEIDLTSNRLYNLVSTDKITSHQMRIID